MAILSASANALTRWPRPARTAFRRAVLVDPQSFCRGDAIGTGAVLLEAARFRLRWGRGLPWPPRPIVPAASAPRSAAAPRRLAARAAAIGLRLARRLDG